MVYNVWCDLQLDFPHNTGDRDEVNWYPGAMGAGSFFVPPFERILMCCSGWHGRMRP